MANLTDAQLAAARRAEEERQAEQEREERREALRGQISQWDDTLKGVNSQIAALSAERSRLDACLGDWDVQRSAYNSSDILSEVVIVNVFEGVCADRIRTELGDCMAKMDQTCTRVGGLNGNVSVQIARLHQYVSLINGKLASLHSELNSI